MIKEDLAVTLMSLKCIMLKMAICQNLQKNVHKLLLMVC